ncbi:transposase [Streptomyces sp. NPDC127117]|uniref:transposase n=1 Tax=Streptomyces sp. NPDC127117 TaxID=3345368 RepID=UPI003625B1B6
MIEPLITAWMQERVSCSATGDPGSCDLREIVNALLYKNRTGRQWRLLPHGFPAWSAVFYCFTLWRQDSVGRRIQEILRWQVRERAWRSEDLSLVISDTRSVRVVAGSAEGDGRTGCEQEDARQEAGARRRRAGPDHRCGGPGRRCHDNEAGIALLDQAAERCGTHLEKVLVDQGFRTL